MEGEEEAGSTNLFPFLKENKDLLDCDVLFMCVPGWKKVPEYTTRLLQIVKPQIVVPFHFDDLSAPLKPNMKAPNMPFQDRPGLLQRISQTAPQAEIRVPQMFETMSFA